jgi:hypothetical protein
LKPFRARFRPKYDKFKLRADKIKSKNKILTWWF